MNVRDTLTRDASLGDRLTLERPPHRLARLTGWMTSHAVDACVITGAEHVTHMGGYSRYYGGASALVVGSDGHRTLIVMRDEVPVAQRLGEADEVVGYGERGFGINLDPVPPLAAALAAVPAVRAARVLGIADPGSAVTAELTRLLSAGTVDLTPALAAIRLVRDEDELVKALYGYELSWLAQAVVGEKAVPGVTEIELLSAAHAAAQIAHGEPIDFAADLLSGPLTAHVCSPIHIPGTRRIEDGDPVIADIVIGAGYSGDTAETHVVGDNREIEQARAALLDILDVCASELRPGVTGSEIFASMQGRVLEAFPGGEMPHHAGHGVSVTAFEDPHMIPSDHIPLENWMLISLEPGIYVPDSHGVRVEAAYIVTPDGGMELRRALGAR